MAVRVVCFVLAIVFASLHLRWEAGIAVAGSLLLPWIAVVVANAGPARHDEAPSLYSSNELDSGE